MFLSCQILLLLWTAYYLAKRITGGLLDLADVVVCGAVIALCVFTGAYKFYKRSAHRRKLP